MRSLKKSKGSGVVYVRSRKRTKEIAQLLLKNSISADYYHAGLPNDSRNKKQAAWMSGKCRVIVATNAFGMGIDKPDVRFVIHIDTPDSLEAYFQEAGRGGRDGKKASAVLLFNNSDKRKLQKNLPDKFPPPDQIKRIYSALGNYFQIATGYGKDSIYDFDIADFARSYNQQIIKIYNSLKILQRCNYLELTEEIDNPSRVCFKIQRDDLYKFQVANSAFDAFIKLLLRSYTGLFSQYTPINETLLARRANTGTEVIYKYLNRLKALNIIDYIPQKKTPYIVYTTERLEEKRLRFSPENYSERKKLYEKQINHVLHYAENMAKCRSQLLVEYFGERTSARCGHCDVCRSRNSLDMNSLEFEKYKDQVKQLLQNEPYSIEQLMIKVTGNTDDAIRVIHWLVDNEKIRYRTDQRLEWI